MVSWREYGDNGLGAKRFEASGEAVPPAKIPIGGCDFGACAPVGQGIFGVDDAAEFYTLHVLVIGLLSAATYEILENVVLPTITQFARGTQGEVGHDYVRNLAREIAKEQGISYCEALQQIYNSARAAGNSKLANDTKATQKQDGCRGH